MKMHYESVRGRVFRPLIYYRIILLPLLAVGISTILISVLFTVLAWHVSGVPAQTKTLAHHGAGHKSSGAAAAATRMKNASPFAIAQQSGNLPISTSVDALSTNLSSYLATLSPNVGVEVYDVTRQRAYTYSSTAQFLTGSSIKVPIMLTFFALTEDQGREPDADEMDLLTTMIENSNNDSASTLYIDINGAAGLTSYFERIGVSGLVPDNDAWGYSQITPQAMVDLLTRLNDGTILTARDRATALYLMQNIETDQQWGIGDTAPGGATFAMKNGWLPGPDGLWTVNTSGIVNAGGETYILSVYTQEQPSLAQGQVIVQHVCNSVASALT